MAALAIAAAAFVLFLAWWAYLDRKLTKNGMPVTWVNPIDIVRGDYRAILDKVSAFLDANGGIGALRSPAGKPFVILNKPEYLKKVLVGVPQRKMHANGVQNPLVGRFSPELLKMERKVSSTIDDTSKPLFKTVTLVFSEALATFSARQSQGNGDFAEAIRSAWWRVRLNLIFGRADWDADTLSLCKKRFYAEVDQFANIFINMFPAAKYLPLPGTLWYRYSVWRLRGRLRSLIAEWEKKSRGSSKGRWAMLHKLKPTDSMDLKVDVCMKMLFVGIGPLTDIVAWFAWHVASDPKVRAEMVAEVDKFAKNNRPITTFQPLAKMPYLDAAYRETLRMYAPVHVGRMSTVPQTVGGFHIPKNSDIMTNMHFLHRSSKYYTNPHRFDPWRFLRERKTTGQTSASERETTRPFLPFGIGARSCPGAQISGCLAKLFVFQLFSEYVVERSSGAQPVGGYNLVMPVRPKGMMLTLRRKQGRRAVIAS